MWDAESTIRDQNILPQERKEMRNVSKQSNDR